MRLDLAHEVRLRAPHEPLDDLLLRERPPELAEHLDVEGDREALAVDEHAVAVEDDELGPHERYRRSRTSAAPSTSARSLANATSRDRYFIPQSGPTCRRSAGTTASARSIRAATSSGV